MNMETVNGKTQTGADGMKTDSEPISLDVMNRKQAAEYLHVTHRKVGLYQKYGLIKAMRAGKGFIYRKAWLDAFMESWAGYDMSSEESVITSIALKQGREKQHGRKEF